MQFGQSLTLDIPVAYGESWYLRIQCQSEQPRAFRTTGPILRIWLIRRIGRCVSNTGNDVSREDAFSKQYIVHSPTLFRNNLCLYVKGPVHLKNVDGY